MDQQPPPLLHEPGRAAGRGSRAEGRGSDVLLTAVAVLHILWGQSGAGQVGPLVWFLLHHAVRLVFFWSGFSLQLWAAPLVSLHQEPVGVCAGAAGGQTAPPPRTGHAQDDPSSQEEASRDEGEAQSAAGLVPAALRQVRAQEVTDDLLSEPGHRNQAEDASQDEARPCGDGRVPLRSAAAPPSGAFKPQGGEAESKQSQHTAQNHGGPRGLQRGRQQQKRGLERAAEDAGGVAHAVHPQTLHLPHGGHQAGPGAAAHLPVGQQSGHGGPHNSEESQRKRQDLDRRGQHRSSESVAAAAAVSWSGPDG